MQRNPAAGELGVRGDAIARGRTDMSIRAVAPAHESLHPGIWVDRLDAFTSALDAIDADDAFSFCEQAWDIWDAAAIADPPSEFHPAMLIIVGVRQALATVTSSAYRSTAGKAGLTLSAAHASLTEELSAVRRECERWDRDGLPSPAEVRTRVATAATGLPGTTKRSA
jgi:hypothetical protein